MSILIKDMEIPKYCIVCKFCGSGSINEFEYWCGLTGSRLGAMGDVTLWEDMRAADCPLVEVPTPHGRLIDDDALYKTYQEICSDIACISCPFLTEDGCKVEQMIMYTPTIIEAEEGEKA